MKWPVRAFVWAWGTLLVVNLIAYWPVWFGNGSK